MQTAPAGLGFALILPSLDFETYSEAGYERDPVSGRWRSMVRGESGLEVVGAWEYAAHPSARVLCACFDMRDGAGVQVWRPGDPPPAPLLCHVAAGGSLSAHNAQFEAAIWALVMVPRFGWPIMDPDRWRCNAAKCRAWGLPGSLGPAAEVMGGAQKDKRGSDLISLLSIPQNKPQDPAALAPLLRSMADYCADDVRAESWLADRLPELTPEEAAVWAVDLRVNARGVAVDWVSAECCAQVAAAESARLDARMAEITGGAVSSGREVAALLAWLKGRGVHMASLAADDVEIRLKVQGPGPARDALEVRRDVALSSVSKLTRILSRMGADNRLRGLFMYHGCATARWSGVGPQPQNLPAGGPAVVRCTVCGLYHGAGWALCSCGAPVAPAEWGPEAQDQALAEIRTCDGEALRDHWSCSPLAVVSGCLRGLFVSGPGFDLIGADFSAIEAVVLAALAGEDWRLEVFRTHGKIYELSAGKILGIPLAEFDRYKAENGSHHPKRKLGKVAELASGYGGGLGAWRNFERSQGVDLGMDDDAIRAAVKAWRAASPAVAAFWGGQYRGGRYDPWGCEGAAIEAVRNPGACYAAGRGGVVSYGCKDGVLYCRLPSGRCIVYQGATVTAGRNKFDRPVWTLRYKAWAARTTGARKSWIDVETYGGALVENICQAVARDLQAAALVRLDRAGYPAVLHVHDEIVAEVREGRGDPDEFRRIMAELPPWAAGWPLRVGAAWRGKRFRK